MRIFIEKLNSIIENIHYKLSGNKEHLVISYEESVNEDKFLQELNDNIGRDKKTKMTGCGPHRDDISFLIGDVDIRKYGSQGQQRSCVLKLKLSECEIIKEKTGEMPPILLDDILSELDEKRRHLFIENIKNTQVIITCTDKEFLKGMEGYYFKVEKGTVKRVI